MSRIYIGIDPGSNGALVALDDTSIRMIYGFKDQTDADICNAFQSVSRLAIPEASFAILELVHSMPAQGVASSFKFGTNFGMVKAFLYAHKIPFDFFTPQKWQKEMGCLTKGDKNVTKSKAQRLFPQVQVTHEIADALLIASYCREIKK